MEWMDTPYTVMTIRASEVPTNHKAKEEGIENNNLTIGYIPTAVLVIALAGQHIINNCAQFHF